MRHLGVADVRPCGCERVGAQLYVVFMDICCLAFQLSYPSAMFLFVPFSLGRPRRRGRPCPDKTTRQPAGSFQSLLDTVMFLPGVPHPQICSSSPATNTFLPFSPATSGEHLLCSRHHSRHWPFSSKPNRQNLCPQGSYILVRETNRTPPKGIMQDRAGTKCDWGEGGQGAGY